MAKTDMEVKIGDSIKPWGKISAIVFTSGERYYMFIDKFNTVSLIPAKIVLDKI